MKKFGELTRKEQRELFDFWLENGFILMLSENRKEIRFVKTPRPKWSPRRVFAIPKIKDQIDWSHVHPDYNCMARDGSGHSYVYILKPRISGGVWRSKKGCLYAEAFTSYKKGTVDWKDSLVIRPGYEEQTNED